MGMVSRGSRLLLLAVSLLLAFHALAVSRFLASSVFLIIAFCWLWVAAAALRGRLEDVNAMALTASSMLAVAAAAVSMASFPAVDRKAFLMLGLFPALTGWISVYIYARHLQRPRDEDGHILDAWFDEHDDAETRRFAQASAAGQRFTDDLTSQVEHDNMPRQSRYPRPGRPLLKAAG